MTDKEEKIIVKKVTAGDSHAFALLVNAYKEMSVLLAYNILLNQEDAEEVAQDAFVKAYTALHAFKAEAKFSTWLYRIVVNAALNKKKLKKVRTDEITAALADEMSADDHNNLGILITAEHRKHIQFALQYVSDNERLCLTLYYLNELSVEEVHEVTRISTANIKVLLHRGRKNLYKAMQKSLRGEITNFI